MRIDKRPLTTIIIILVGVFFLLIIFSPDSNNSSSSKNNIKKTNTDTILETKTDEQIAEIINEKVNEGLQEEVELPKVLAVSIELEDEIKCTWIAENSFSYKVSIGTEPKKDDIKSWTYVADTTLSFMPVNYSKNNKYFCNVIATRSYLESEITSSTSPVSYP